MINKINLNDEAEVTCFLQVVKTTLLLALISAFSVVNFGLILWEEKEVEWKLIENNGGLRVICKTTMIIAFLSLIASILFLVSAANFHFLFYSKIISAFLAALNFIGFLLTVAVTASIFKGLGKVLNNKVKKNKDRILHEFKRGLDEDDMKESVKESLNNNMYVYLTGNYLTFVVVLGCVISLVFFALVILWVLFVLKLSAIEIDNDTKDKKKIFKINKEGNSSSRETLEMQSLRQNSM